MLTGHNKRTAAAFIAGIVVFVTAADARSHRPPPDLGKADNQAQQPPGRGEQKVDPEQRGTEQSPFVVQVIGAEPKTQGNANQDSAGADRRSIGRWMCAAAIALAVMAVLQLGAFVVMAIRLGQTIRSQEDNAKRQLRAYVSALPEFIYAFGENEFPRARFKIHNTGATPAHFVQYRGNVVIVSEPLVVGHRFPELESSFSAPVAAFPNLPFLGRIQARDRFTKTDIIGVRTGSARIYVYGEVLYIDAFSEVQTTRFCASLAADSATLVKLTSRYEPDDLKIEFEAAPMGNTTT
jgi:hypothetical protein